MVEGSARLDPAEMDWLSFQLYEPANDLFNRGDGHGKEYVVTSKHKGLDGGAFV